MTIVAYTDGASRSNPGEAGIGIVLKNESGEILATEKKYLGIATNNVAEYSALIRCLELVSSNGTLHCRSLVVHTDSELMTRQVNGQYKVKDSQLKILHQKVKALAAAAEYSFTIKHIPRSLNKEADQLANDAIDTKA
jgi:ribonuclease HI